MNNQCLYEYNTMIFQFLQASNIDISLYFLKMTGNFRENLRNELDYQNITVKELCVKTGIPKATLECYLGTRANRPSADAAFKIARALGVTMEYLMTEHNSPEEKARTSANAKTRELVRIIEELNGDGYEIILTLGNALKRMQNTKK
jgi:transcriptional regulator with XRE-family HTH domain